MTRLQNDQTSIKYYVKEKLLVVLHRHFLVANRLPKHNIVNWIYSSLYKHQSLFSKKKKNTYNSLCVFLQFLVIIVPVSLFQEVRQKVLKETKVTGYLKKTLTKKVWTANGTTAISEKVSGRQCSVTFAHYYTYGQNQLSACDYTLVCTFMNQCNDLNICFDWQLLRPA